MQVVRIDDHGVLPRPGGARRLPQRRWAALPRRPPPDRGLPAGGHEHGARRPAAPLGPVARARRLQPARGADAARARLRRGRRRWPAPDRAPAVHRRARDPVRRHEPDGRVQERVRHRRVRHRPVHELARAGLRLPGRDPLPRRRHARQPRHAAGDPQRDLPARGGRRDPLEALRLAQRRHRRAPRAPARDLDDRDRRQLRVRVLLVPRARRLRGVRGQAHGRAPHRRRRAGRGIALGDARRARRERRLPPALLLRAARPRRGRRAQRPLGGRVGARAARPRQPARAGLQRAGDAARERALRPAA